MGFARTYNHRKNRGFSTLAITAALAFGASLSMPIVAHALSDGSTDESQAEDDALMDTIFVTATRRETSLQDTSIAITAFGEDDLVRNNISDIRGLDLLTPGLFIGGNAGFGTTPVAIRGIGSLALGIGADEGVGIYIDGVYQARGNGAIFEFADIERVEVLRGPQGTLFGRNATGGAINIVSKTPGDEFEASFETEITEFRGFGVSGYVMAPLIEDKLSVKFSGASFQDDGFQFNPTRNEDLSSTDNTYFSSALRYTPTENTTIDLRGYLGTTQTPIAYKNLNDGLPLDTIPADAPSSDKRDFEAISTTITQDFGSVEAKLTAGWLQTEYLSRTDSDGGPEDNVLFFDEGSNEQYSVELLLSSTTEGRFQWLLGANYFTDQSETFVPFNFLRTLPGGPVALIFAADIETESYSGFAEFSYDLTDRLTFTSGVRYTTDQKDWLGCFQFGAFTLLDVDFDRSACDGN